MHHHNHLRCSPPTPASLAMLVTIRTTHPFRRNSIRQAWPKTCRAFKQKVPGAEL